MEKCLYDNGKTTHFSKYGELPCIRAKQINRGIPMFVEDGKLRFKLRKMQFGIQVNDRFQSDELTPFCLILRILTRWMLMLSIRL